MGRIAHFLGSFATDAEVEAFIISPGWSPADYSGMVSNNKEPGLEYLNTTTGQVRTWSGAVWAEAGGFSTTKTLVTGTLNEAVAAAGASKTTLVIYKLTDVPANLTVPENIYLEFARNGRLDISAALVLLCSLTGPSRRLFRFFGAGSLNAMASPTTGNARWFGATGDGVTDDEADINAALVSFKAVFVPLGVYRHNRIWLNDGNELFGEGPGKTIFKMNDNVAMPATCMGIGQVDGIDTFSVHDFEYDGNSAGQGWFNPAAPHTGSPNGISMSQGCGGAPYSQPKHVEIHNIYSHDCLRNPFMIAADSVNASNLRARNSYGDHLIYIQHSFSANVVNVVCEGYWYGSAICTQGQSFSNVTFKDLAENPFNPVLELICFINDRGDIDEELKGSNFVNVLCEYNPALSIAQFAKVASAGFKIVNVELQPTTADTSPFPLIYIGTSTRTKGIVVENVHVRDAEEGFRLLDVSNNAEDISFIGINIEYASGGAVDPDELLRVSHTLTKLLVRGLRTSTEQASELLRVMNTATLNDALFEDIHMDTKGNYVIFNDGDIDGLTIKDSVFEDSSGTSLRGLISTTADPDSSLDNVLVDNVRVVNRTDNYGLLVGVDANTTSRLMFRNVVGNWGDITNFPTDVGAFQNCTFNGGDSPIGGASVYGLFDVRQYGALGNGVDDEPAVSAALAAAGAAGGDLTLPPGSYLIDSNMVIPDGIALCGRGGVLVPGVGVTITQGAKIDTPRIPLFDCTSGDVVASAIDGAGEREIHVEWFGATLDGGTDDLLAWDAAIAYLDGRAGIIHMGYGESVISATLEIPEEVIIEGISTAAGQSQIEYTGTGIAVHFTNAQIRHSGLRNIRIRCTSNAATVRGLQVDGGSAYSNRFEHVTVIGAGTDVAGADTGIGVLINGNTHEILFSTLRVVGFGYGVVLGDGAGAYANSNKFVDARFDNITITPIYLRGGGHNVFSICQIEGCDYSVAAIHIEGDGGLIGSKNDFSDFKIGDNAGATAPQQILIEDASMNVFVNMQLGEGAPICIQFTRTSGDVTGNCFVNLVSNLMNNTCIAATDHARCFNNIVQGSARIDYRLPQVKRQIILGVTYAERFITKQTPEAFGATGTTDQAAFVAAVAYLVAAGGGDLELLPGKSYDIDDDLTVSATVRLVGRGGVLTPANAKTITVVEDILCGAEQIFDRSAGGEVLLPSDVVARSEWFGDAVTVQTNDATVTSLVEHTIEDNSVYLIEARVTARETDNSGRAAYGKAAVVYRAGGGATLQGAVQDIFADIESVGGWDVTIDANGNTFRVRVTGAVGDTVDWSGDIRFRVLR